MREIIVIPFILVGTVISLILDELVQTCWIIFLMLAIIILLEVQMGSSYLIIH